MVEVTQMFLQCSLENNLPTFQLNAPVVIRVKAKRCEQPLLFIAMLETRLKEHRDACEREMMEKLAIAKHAWENHHPIG